MKKLITTSVTAMALVAAYLTINVAGAEKRAMIIALDNIEALADDEDSVKTKTCWTTDPFAEGQKRGIFGMPSTKQQHRNVQVSRRRKQQLWSKDNPGQMSRSINV